MTSDRNGTSRSGVRAVRNVLANWGAFLLSAAVGLFLSPYVVHHLGNTQYGVWVLLGSLVSYLGFLDLGVRGAVMRFVANQHAGGKHEEAGRFASAGLAMFSFLGLFAILAAAGLAAGARQLFTIPESMVGTARLVLILGGFNIAIVLVTGVFGGIITARQRFDIISSVEITIEVVRACLVVLALYAGYGLVTLAVVQLSVSLARGITDYVFSRRLYPELHIALRSWSRQHVRQLLTFSGYAALLNLSGMIILQLDAVVIGAFLPVAMITFFAIAANLTVSGRSLISGISQTVSPHVSALQGSGEGVKAGRVILQSGRLAGLVLLPIVLTFILRGSAFIGIWMGPAYAELSGKVLFVLSLMLGVTAGRQVIAAALLGLNQHKPLVPVFMLEAAVNLGLSILLVKRFGILGVAWGSTVPGLISSLILVPRILCQVQNVRLVEVWWQLWLRPFIAMIPFALALFGSAHVWEPTTLPGFFTEIALILPIAALGVWTVGLDIAERTALMERVRALRLLQRRDPAARNANTI